MQIPRKGVKKYLASRTEEQRKGNDFVGHKKVTKKEKFYTEPLDRKMQVNGLLK